MLTEGVAVRGLERIESGEEGHDRGLVVAHGAGKEPPLGIEGAAWRSSSRFVLAPCRAGRCASPERRDRKTTATE